MRSILYWFRLPRERVPTHRGYMEQLQNGPNRLVRSVMVLPHSGQSGVAIDAFKCAPHTGIDWELYFIATCPHTPQRMKKDRAQTT